jgi:hypothetical protein
MKGGSLLKIALHKEMAVIYDEIPVSQRKGRTSSRERHFKS